VASAEREHYLAQLRAGQGYGPEHRGALVQLQQAQRQARNHPGGYWIAETEPEAAHHGITTTLGLDSITWVALATDGAADLIDPTGPSWPKIAHNRVTQAIPELRQTQTMEVETIHSTQLLAHGVLVVTTAPLRRSMPRQVPAPMFLN
jgi:hypothetical protein